MDGEKLQISLNHLRLGERLSRGLGSLALGGGGVLSAIIIGHLAHQGPEGINTAAYIWDGLALAMGASGLSAASSLSGSADVINAELLRREDPSITPSKTQPDLSPSA